MPSGGLPGNGRLSPSCPVIMGTRRFLVLAPSRVLVLIGNRFQGPRWVAFNRKPVVRLKSQWQEKRTEDEPWGTDV
ncbi:hypothetical protein VULLAG_LOCUS21178 [Vulpes lagopus]